ncbi:thioredoxin family protein [Flavitalea sp. BT771]|uniref:TlpA family protein disulfide reductase n=1 Tax=Flavitalea sp. BT771 TaxID=3063329 RepID=UPI0026E4013C|nr:thioredoxin family protein [Flavitalea sp. BT771]MDO6431250.1 thioredoxin family protein [Flavitalea sp. BT771]MDV6220158.1 thioredoxin family protein [Flavitalea sp. BT771]
MKPSFSYIALFIYTLLCISCHHQLSPQGPAFANLEVNDAHGNPQLLGKTSRERLEQPPYRDWFMKSYDAYPIDSITAARLRAGLAGKHLIVFLGTWCGDSRREVPRLFKLLDCCGIASSAVDIVTVSNSDSLYKQSPNHEEKGLNIFRVPDFIVLDKGREIGRIVESPVVSLEKDLLSIVSGAPYTPHYQGGALLADVFRRGQLGKVKAHLPELIERLRPLVSSPGELTSYAKVLQTSGEPEKAELVRELNSRLFPAGK